MGPAPSPALADPARVRFVALGDAGKGTAGQDAVAASVRAVCALEGCDFVLLLGDNLYPAGFEWADDPRAQAWIADPYTPAAPVYAVLGNHDWAVNRAEIAARQLAWAERTGAVVMPSHAWWFDAGPLRLVGLDTTSAMHRGHSAQAAWAEPLLADEGPAYTIAAAHHPYRSDGPHGNAGAYEGWSHVPVLSGGGVAQLYESAVCARADLVLSGHDHTRQWLDACGVAQVVAGTGASGSRIVDRGNHPAFADAELGFVWLTVGDDGSGELRFYGVDGRVDAAFPLPQKSPNGPP